MLEEKPSQPPPFSGPQAAGSTGVGRSRRDRNARKLLPVLRTVTIVISVFILCARNYKKSLTVVEKLDGHLEELAFWLPHARREDATSFVATVDNKDSATASAEIANRASPSSPYAYVFMMFRVDPRERGPNQHRGSYKPYIANILIAAEMFHRLGSTSDIVALISMIGGYDSLPNEDAQLLQKLGVKIRYFTPVVPDNTTSFVTSQMNKIELLNLTEYRRVLYLDCDVIPLANLDYMFRFSETTMKPNIILATRSVPLIGGLFVLEPNMEGLEELKRLVHKKIVIDAGKKWDKQKGWGVELSEETPAEHNGGPVHHWGFLAANGDQGLLYHYARFWRRNVTQIFLNKLLHYGPGPNGTSVLEREDNITQLNNPFAKATQRHFQSHLAPTCRHMGTCHLPGPYVDHAHFLGTGDHDGKPWETSNPEKYRNASVTVESGTHLWWKTLYELEDLLNFSYTTEWSQVRLEQE